MANPRASCEIAHFQSDPERLLSHSAASPQHIGTLLDCAEICQTSANFMLRGSPMHARTCGVCAEACERCATECEQMANGDQQMLACAEQCRRCAESCRQMAKMA